MRAAFLPLLFLLAACSGTLSGFSPDAAAPAEPAAMSAAPAPPPSATAARARPSPSAGGASSAGGGARTAASRPPPEPGEPPQNDPLTQARVDCWMKVEGQKAIRDIDRRITFVDKCVAEKMKGQQ